MPAGRVLKSRPAHWSGMLHRQLEAAAVTVTGRPSCRTNISPAGQICQTLPTVGNRQQPASDKYQKPLSSKLKPAPCFFCSSKEFAMPKSCSIICPPIFSSPSNNSWFSRLGQRVNLGEEDLGEDLGGEDLGDQQHHWAFHRRCSSFLTTDSSRTSSLGRSFWWDKNCICICIFFCICICV